MLSESLCKPAPMPHRRDAQAGTPPGRLREADPLCKRRRPRSRVNGRAKLSGLKLKSSRAFHAFRVVGNPEEP